MLPRCKVWHEVVNNPSELSIRDGIFWMRHCTNYTFSCKCIYTNVNWWSEFCNFLLLIVNCHSGVRIMHRLPASLQIQTGGVARKKNSWLTATYKNIAPSLALTNYIDTVKIAESSNLKVGGPITAASLTRLQR